ncbi:hypothetical protein N8T08_002369 [Aspergillus melleus]|uniref:Uncharacterized protein n=1 Tax=Aspergillus melleus TaxID=138277 RepID=A0ACC3AM87_9EURO|nr:hypothetical protein N8T08_002369 [Aspergillus melleus]
MCFLRFIAAAGLAIEAAGHTQDDPGSFEEAQAQAHSCWDYTFGYSGISTFGHLKHRNCLLEPDLHYDIGIIGVPFDTAVSYRPGARFGPRAIRAASNRHLPSRSFSPYAGINPYQSWATIYDCGGVPTTPFDNNLALRQMTSALRELSSRPWAADPDTPRKLLILGGDHSVSLPALRALSQAHGQPLAVVHFDAHLDTLHSSSYPSVWTSE